MKNITLITSFGVALMLLFASCSVEKRHYSKGYNVNWHAKAPKAEEPTAQKPAQIANSPQTEQQATKPANPVKESPSQTNHAKATPAKVNPPINNTIEEEGTQSASAGDSDTPENTVKPYEFKANEATKVAKLKAKPLFDISHLKRVAEGSDILAILAFVFGVIALFSYYASFFFALAAIIMGAIALGRTSGTMHLLALLGLIFGLIAIILWAALFAFVITF